MKTSTRELLEVVKAGIAALAIVGTAILALVLIFVVAARLGEAVSAALE
jgi:hypothetical protein